MSVRTQDLNKRLDNLVYRMVRLGLVKKGEVKRFLSSQSRSEDLEQALQAFQNLRKRRAVAPD